MDNLDDHHVDPVGGLKTKIIYVAKMYTYVYCLLCFGLSLIPFVDDVYILPKSDSSKAVGISFKNFGIKNKKSWPLQHITNQTQYFDYAAKH